jgi:hypothetical protein
MLALFLALLGGCDPFADVQEADTIEAYEAYLQNNPNSTNRLQAEGRLATLLLEKARKDGTIESYDAFLARFPKSSLVKDAQKERKELLWARADQEDTVAAWKALVDEFSKPDKEGGDRELVKRAKRRLRMATHKADVEISPVEMEMVNLAEDPDGPLNGYGFFADVKNVGTKPITMLKLRIQYLDGSGNPVGEGEWPVVASQLPGNLPMPEGFDKPIAPGETRRWEWTTGDMPDGWAKKSKLTAVDIRVEGDTD